MSTQISAKIVADSINQQGDRITSMLVTFPRIVLSEFNTHRMFSRNTSSSRAIPFEKLLKTVQEDPFIPIAWQKNHSGMQGTEYFESGMEIKSFEVSWLRQRDNAVQEALFLSKDLNGSKGVTKQIVNRLIEQWMWTTVLVTSTEWENFFYLRCPQYSLFSENIPLSFRSKRDLLNY